MTGSVPKADHIINGERVAAKDYKDVVDPGRLDEVVAQCGLGTPEDVDKAAKVAYAAFPGWRDTDPAERAALVTKSAEVLNGCAEKLAPQLCREHGGVLWEAQLDFGAGAGTLMTTAAQVEDFYRPQVVEDDDCVIRVEHAPKGVVSGIVPWNMPVVLTMMKIAPALTTGNCLMVKPSSSAPAALTLALEKMAAVFPPGVLNVVNGSGALGEALATHPLVRKVGFTGGTDTGVTVMRNAAGTIKNVTLELGGNDAAILLRDADIDLAIPRLLKGIFTRTGQICFAVKRIYVQRSIYDTFVDALVAAVGEFVVGHGLDEGVIMGPLHNKAQFDSVQSLLKQTQNSSAKVIELGKKADPDQWDNGYYMLPHVVRDIEHSAPLSSCEQFGPIIPVIAFDTEGEAVDYANDSEWGLCSSVWSKDTEHALTLARRIEAGTTFINEHSLFGLDLRMPFGGVKQSGIGREYSHYAMEEYSEYHVIKMMKH